MNHSEIIKYIHKDYQFSGKTKIRNIDLDKMEFTIRLGDCMADIPFGKSLVREIKLRQLGI